MNKKDFRSYLLEMEQYHNQQKEAHNRNASPVLAQGDKRLADFCGHLIQRLDENQSENTLIQLALCNESGEQGVICGLPDDLGNGVISCNVRCANGSIHKVTVRQEEVEP